MAAMTQEKAKESSYAKASDPADKQRKAQEAVERAPSLSVHIECSVSYLYITATKGLTKK